MPDYFAPYLQARQRGNAQRLSILQEALQQKKAAEQRRSLSVLEESMRQQREQAEREYRQTTPAYRLQELQMANYPAQQAQKQQLFERTMRTPVVGSPEWIEAQRAQAEATYQYRFSPYGRDGRGGEGDLGKINQWQARAFAQQDPFWQEADQNLRELERLEAIDKAMLLKSPPAGLPRDEQAKLNALRVHRDLLRRTKAEVEDRIARGKLPYSAYESGSAPGGGSYYPQEDEYISEAPEPTLDDILADPELRALLGLQ